MALTEIAAVTGATIVLVVLMEDPIVHDDEHPTCSDRSCPCQADKPVRPAPRRLNSDDYIPEYPCLPQETTWYEC
ncbi:MAG: hypothetical protein ACJ788_03195 [Ktedonobacteraceae bacterium]